MNRLPRLAVQYFTLNLTVLPANPNQQEYYSSLIERLFQAHIPINYGDYFYRITKLDAVTLTDEVVFYGLISKYVSLDGLEWVEEESDDPIDYTVPDNVKGRRATYEFIFYPAGHKFAFIKKGRIDQEVKRRGAPLKAIANILKLAFDILLDSENKTAEVNIIQSEQIFDEIYSSVVKSLDLTVSYSNPGLGDDHEQIMDDYLREAHVGKTRVTMQPDSTGEIDTDSIFARGLLDLARENGKVKAKIETEDGPKTINTESHPDVNVATIEKSGDIERKFIIKIIQQLRRTINHE